MNQYWKTTKSAKKPTPQIDRMAFCYKIEILFIQIAFQSMHITQFDYVITIIRLNMEQANLVVPWTFAFVDFTKTYCPCWRHQIETFSALLALCAGKSPATGEFPSQRPVIRSFDVFFDLHLNKWLSKQSRRRWFKQSRRRWFKQSKHRWLVTPSPSLWCHCIVLLYHFPIFWHWSPVDSLHKGTVMQKEYTCLYVFMFIVLSQSDGMVVLLKAIA